MFMETQSTNNRQQMREILRKPSEELIQSNEELNSLEELAVNTPFAFDQNPFNIDLSYLEEENAEDYFDNQSIEDFSGNYDVSLDGDSIFTDEGYETEFEHIEEDSLDPMKYVQDQFEIVNKKVKSYAKENMDRELDRGPLDADLDRVVRLARRVNEEPRSEWEKPEIVVTDSEYMSETPDIEFNLGQDPRESEEDILDRMRNKTDNFYDDLGGSKLDEVYD